jgi:diguanylate cyclase (GGDEF)-like protein
VPASLQNTSRQDDTQDQQGRMSAALTHLLYAQSASVIIGSILIATCLVFTVRNTQPAHELNSWYLLILGMLALIYLGILLLASFRAYNAIRNTLMLRFENETLHKKLHTEANEHKQAVELLRSSKEQYAVIMDALPGLVAYIDHEFRYQFINKAFETWFNKPADEIRGNLVKETLNNADYETLLAHCPKNADKISYETVMRFHNEKERYVSVTLIPNLKNNIVSGFYLLISDVTPRINYLATHDTLTSLPNRSLFIARFTRALKFAQAYRKSVGLLFLDLDYFKNINDTLGHDLGDQLLIKVSERLQNCIRRNDTLARLGGDEFTVIFEAIDDIEDVIKVAQKICKSFYDAFNVNGREVFITTSIGISIYPNDGHEIQTLLKNADIAMYRAKERGRNTFEFFTREINEKIVKKIALEVDLRLALEKQQFHIYYQPLIDIHTGQIESVEALLRWYVPNAGIIMPAEFIPLAEQTGLIVPIGEWVLHTVCMQGYQWQKEGIKPLKLCVNLSGNQFKDYRSLLEKISSILNKTKIAGKYLTIEITESAIMDDIDYSIKTIKALKELGVTIALDDFGTGYSSLSYLNCLPIDIIKIDRAFIADLTVSESSAKIVTAVINMAHNLKLIVVAEGVETFEQYSLLKFLGCDQIQGYLIHPPLRVEEISSILTSAFSFEEHIKIRQLHQLTKDLDNQTSSEPIR